MPIDHRENRPAPRSQCKPIGYYRGNRKREKLGQQIGFWMSVLHAGALHAGQGDGLEEGGTQDIERGGVQNPSTFAWGPNICIRVVQGWKPDTQIAVILDSQTSLLRKIFWTYGVKLPLWGNRPNSCKNLTYFWLVMFMWPILTKKSHVIPTFKEKLG
jgi:hypothetical protein